MKLQGYYNDLIGEAAKNEKEITIKTIEKIIKKRIRNLKEIEEISSQPIKDECEIRISELYALLDSIKKLK
jgi:hypothetical protein